MADKGRRVPLNMRTTQETRDRIEAAAHKSGRSLAQEIEHIVEMHFMVEDVLDRISEGMRASQQAPPPKAYIEPRTLIRLTRDKAL